MDKISKRSKGYAFVEYTTLEAASAALKEMNGKVILEQCAYLLSQNHLCLTEMISFKFVESYQFQKKMKSLLILCTQIINGWMITVDVAKTNPPKYSRGRPGTAR